MGGMNEPGVLALREAFSNHKWTCERVLSVHYWTATLLSFRTTRYRSFRFTPGHYARLGLASAAGSLVWRPYSLVSAAYDDHLEFLAVLFPGGEFSEALSKLRVGDAINVEKPSYGFLTVDQLAPGHDLWLLASGTGLGPFISILRDPATWLGFDRLIVVHSVRQAAELAYRQEIDTLNSEAWLSEGGAELIYLPVVTRDPGATTLAARIPQLFAAGTLEAAARSVSLGRDV